MPLSDRLSLGFVGALATRGDEIVAAVENPPGVALYDVRSERLRVLPDPFGTPIDVAVGADRTIFAINVARSGAPVTMYRGPHDTPVELNCAAVTFGEAMAVDDEGDLFIDGYGPNLAGVAEIPIGAHGPDAAHCFVLPLKGDAGYVAGVGVDPRTDDLLTLDDPDFCAGGREGRLTIYPRPYDRRTGRSHIIGINCSGGLRLNDDSTLVFIGDTSVDESASFILQRSFPDGASLGVFEGGHPSGFTTLPSDLPN